MSDAPVPRGGVVEELLDLGGPVADLRHGAGIQELRVRIGPTRDDPTRTLVELSAPLEGARRMHYRVGITLGGALAAMGGAEALEGLLDALELDLPSAPEPGRLGEGADPPTVGEPGTGVG